MMTQPLALPIADIYTPGKDEEITMTNQVVNRRWFKGVKRRVLKPDVTIKEKKEKRKRGRGTRRERSLSRCAERINCAFSLLIEHGLGWVTKTTKMSNI